MQHATENVEVGLDQIGRLFGRSRWAVARWIRSHGFPAARLPDGKWFTTRGMIEGWALERRARDPLLRHHITKSETE